MLTPGGQCQKRTTAFSPNGRISDVGNANLAILGHFLHVDTASARRAFQMAAVVSPTSWGDRCARGPEAWEADVAPVRTCKGL